MIFFQNKKCEDESSTTSQGSVFGAKGNLLCVNHKLPGGMEAGKTKRCREWQLGKVGFVIWLPSTWTPLLD